MTKKYHSPMEIVAPSGDMDCLKAAVLAGTNAIYLGLRGYGARRLATNFTVDELKTAIDYAHLRGVRLYCTLNTLMTDKEIERLYPAVQQLYLYGLDGVIVQDWGVYRFLKTHFPDFTYHASTQMTLGNHVEAAFLEQMGLDRLVPARELSLDEIKTLKQNTTIELEIFVSGALCISYSGNCYLSSFIGGRSGNRGMCTQACRRLYMDVADDGYYLSPKDQLMGQKEIDEFKKLGVEALKIEGRMKSPSYVYSAVRYFADLLAGKRPEPVVTKIFNRGYSKGYLYGQEGLMNPQFPSNFGYPLGTLNRNEIKLTDDVVLGDGISYLDEEMRVIGGEYINRIIIKWKTGTHKSAKAGEVIVLSQLPAETKFVHKTYSKKLNDDIDHRLKTEKRTIPVYGKLTARMGEVLSFTLRYQHEEVTVTGDILAAAQKLVLTPAEIKEKLSEMGDSTFQLAELVLNYDEACFIPLKTIKQVKRDAMEQLTQKVLVSYRRTNAIPLQSFNPVNQPAAAPKIAVCVSEVWQETLAREQGIEIIYHKGIDAAREGNLNQVDLDSILASNLYQLLHNKNDKVTLNWNFNVTNSRAFAEYAKIPKVETIYLSPELNLAQLQEIKGTGAKKGLVIYGQLEGMLIEPEIFEEDYKEIQNDTGDRLIAVKNKCHNTEIYLAEPMSLIPKLDEIKALELDELRLDFQFETKEEMQKILTSVAYASGKYNPYNYERGLL